MPDVSWLRPAVAAFLDSRMSLLLAMSITTEKKEKRIHEELAGNDFSGGDYSENVQPAEYFVRLSEPEEEFRG